MRRLKAFWRNLFDIRPGEYFRTALMALHLLFVLFSYYILKTVSKALFLNRFDIDRLPYLVILIAVAGGFLAYLYTKLAVATSLRAAVSWTMGTSVPCLALFWWLLRHDIPWVYYAFNVWVSLFSIVLVSQGWLIASNVFNAREAKRVYGLLGFAAILGAFLGSLFTKFAAGPVGPRNLVLASAGFVIVAYVPFRLVLMLKNVSLARARAAEAEETELHFRDIAGAIARHRHLQVIIAIITLIFIVDVLVDFQLSYMAKQTYSNARGLTGFWASFNLYQNILTMFLQFFVTALVVGRLGVGGTMQIMPVTMTLASLGIFGAPGLVTTTIAGLAERASRYSFNRTGMELLYMPLPIELRNRTKAFVDIFVDRMGRGITGTLLIVLGWAGIEHPRQISLLVIVFAGVWVALSLRARREYILTIRNRLETRRLDLESARVLVSDPATVGLLEQAAAGPNPRQACYALSVLAEAPGYDLRPLLVRLAGSPSPEVRGKVYELARAARAPELFESAMAEVRSPRPGQSAAIPAAVAYVLSVSPEPSRLVKDFLDHPETLVGESALAAIAGLTEAQELVDLDWITENAGSPDPSRRRLAALAIGVHGDQGTEWLHRLLADPDPGVVAAACRSAGALKNRAYLHSLIRLLADARQRGPAIEALAAFGTRISGTLGDLLEDYTVPVGIRRQIPRILLRVPDQRSVNVLLGRIGEPDLSVRAAVLRALNRLREAAPQLDYGATFVTRQILSEARQYCEMHAALEPLRQGQKPGTASALLVRTLEERLTQTIERLFRLLGLRYPPKEIYAAYLAVKHRRGEELSAALEFLDNVLDRELKRALLPLLDSPARLGERGRELFGIEARTAESAIHELIRSGDPWLVACATAAAAELGLRNLIPDIRRAADQGGKDVALVARSAVAALA